MNRLLTMKAFVAGGLLLFAAGCQNHEPVATPDETPKSGDLPLSRPTPATGLPGICGPYYVFQNEPAKFYATDYILNELGKSGLDWEIQDASDQSNDHFTTIVSADGLEFTVIPNQSCQAKIKLFYTSSLHGGRVLAAEKVIYGRSHYEIASLQVNKLAVIRQPGGPSPENDNEYDNLRARNGWRITAQYPIASDYLTLNIKYQLYSGWEKLYDEQSVTLYKDGTGTAAYFLVFGYGDDKGESPFIMGERPQFSQHVFDDKYKYELNYFNENEGNEVHWGECETIFKPDGSCNCPYVNLAFLGWGYEIDWNSEPYNQLIRDFAELLMSETAHVDHHNPKTVDEMIEMLKSATYETPARVTKYKNRTTELQEGEYGLWQNDPLMQDIWNYLSPTYNFEKIIDGHFPTYD